MAAKKENHTIHVRLSPDQLAYVVACKGKLTISDTIRELIDFHCKAHRGSEIKGLSIADFITLFKDKKGKG